MNYRIAFPADYKNVPPLRDLIYHCAMLQGFENQKAEHLRSVVDEICNNAIEHGSQPTSEVQLDVHTDDNTIRIICQDQGHGNKMKAAEIQQAIDAGVEQGAARGRGMGMIVKSFVDEMLVEDRKEGGIKVSVKLQK